MKIKLIGKFILGELGFCQVPEKMGENYAEQLKEIQKQCPIGSKIVMTSMTNFEKVDAAEGNYMPQIVMYQPELHDLFDPCSIYANCVAGLDSYRPAVDFIIEKSGNPNLVLATFSREAPILAFQSNKGDKALGCITRKSLMTYGDFLFQQINNAFEKAEEKEVFLVSCNKYEYPEGSTPSVVHELAKKYEFCFRNGLNSETCVDCYHRGEKGNHVVAIW